MIIYTYAYTHTSAHTYMHTHIYATICIQYIYIYIAVDNRKESERIEKKIKNKVIQNLLRRKVDVKTFRFYWTFIRLSMIATLFSKTFTQLLFLCYCFSTFSLIDIIYIRSIFMRFMLYHAKTITDGDYVDDIVLQANAPALAESLLRSLERAAAGIGLHVNIHKTEYMCFSQTGDISTLNRSSQKL